MALLNPLLDPLRAALRRQLAERLTLLSGLNAPEFFDRRLFSGLLDALESEGWLCQDNARRAFDSLLQEALARSRSLFDPALRQRLLQLARQHEVADPQLLSAVSPEAAGPAQPRSER